MPTPGNGADQPVQIGDELPVKLDTLMVGGQRPEVGDQVEAKVSGTVSRIVNDCCYVRLETANNEPIESHNDDQEGDDLSEQSQQADMAGVPIGGSLNMGGAGY